MGIVAFTVTVLYGHCNCWSILLLSAVVLATIAIIVIANTIAVSGVRATVATTKVSDVWLWGFVPNLSIALEHLIA